MSSVSAEYPPRSAPLTVRQWAALAFVYWVVFMGALVPGNVQHLVGAGITPDWGRELLRLTGAGLLGASVTPVLLALARRFSIERERALPNLALQGLGVVILSPSLIVVSCFLAAWVFGGRVAPSAGELESQLFANFLLLVVCISLLLAAIQVAPHVAARRARSEKADESEDGRKWLDHLTISERGRLIAVDMRDVEWIEAQGNYQALHTAHGTHLYRESSARLCARLDPTRFIRIHRRYIVALDRIREIETLPSGDGSVKLANGTELRLSRAHRRELRARLGAANS